MEVVRGFLDAQIDAPGSSVSIGNFDGMHIGHQAAIKSAVNGAQRAGVRSVVCTFDPHTRLVLTPHAPPRMLETLEQRLAGIERMGADVALVVPFSMEVAGLPREEFVSEFIRGTLDAATLHVSKAFTFGARGAGNVAYLREISESAGFTLQIVPQVFSGGRPVSSTRIRDAVVEGRLDAAAKLLGRPFALDGEVVRGEGRGRTLDAPTANLAYETACVPARGVYVAEARLGSETYRAVVNVGVRPTFGHDGEVSVEAHLLDAGVDLYGRRMELAFLHKLRDEIAFESAEALMAQIRDDVEGATRYFADADR